MKRFKDKDRTLTGEALDQYLRKHKNIQQLAETLIKVNEIDAKRKPKPLTDEEIKQIWYNLYPLSSSSYWDDKREGLAELKFARAIEERHGIK